MWITRRRGSAAFVGPVRPHGGVGKSWITPGVDQPSRGLAHQWDGHTPSCLQEHQTSGRVWDEEAAAGPEEILYPWHAVLIGESKDENILPSYLEDKEKPRLPPYLAPRYYPTWNDKKEDRPTPLGFARHMAALGDPKVWLSPDRPRNARWFWLPSPLYWSDKKPTCFALPWHALKKSRDYELRAIAGGRKTDAEVREQTRLRVAKHRAKRL
jgi:hypothetical protein